MNPLLKTQNKIVFTLYVAVFFTATFFLSCVSLKEQNRSFFDKETTVALKPISLEDQKIVSSTLSLLESFYYLSNDDLNNAEKISKRLLYTDNLSLFIYKYSFVNLAYVKFISLSKKTDPNSEIDFHQFQNLLCSEICESIGWKLLLKKDPDLFTPIGFQNQIFSDQILFALKLQKSKFMSEFLFDGIYENNTFVYKQNEDQINEDVFKNYELPPLKLFENGEFEKSIESFTSLAKKNADHDFRSISYYWIGRSYYALKKYSLAEGFFLKSGIENPLGLYDSLSGQMLRNSSGRSSTREKSPFSNNFEDELHKWIAFPDINSNSQIVKTLKSSIAIITRLKLENSIERQDDFQEFFLKYQGIESILLKDQIYWLKSRWLTVFENWDKKNMPEVIGSDIAWLLYIMGDIEESYQFVTLIKDSLDSYSDNNNFLYFLFYPRFNRKEIAAAVKICPVDPDLVYAVISQEKSEKMTLNDNKILEITCMLQKTLNSFQDGIVQALTAYKVGAEKTDDWRKKIIKIEDDVVFMELIPDLHVKKFVCEALKKYYNIKWIYFKN